MNDLILALRYQGTINYIHKIKVQAVHHIACFACIKDSIAVTTSIRKMQHAKQLELHCGISYFFGTGNFNN